ncbi:MAG: S8 family serine peptidase [Candidatus Zixiibacteriota bacterium]|nr:MAG: S8 family serine peptidase [candidate division Zixibacteria bacterium]
MYDNTIAENPKNDKTAYWILFDSKSDDIPIQVSNRSLQRRRAKSDTEFGCWYDYPVKPDYLLALREAGARIRHISRWLNAASVSASPEVLDGVSRLSFVKDIKRVSSYSNPREYEIQEIYAPAITSVFDYGPSYNQIAMLAVDSLHDQGYSGAGILVGIMDTGFDYNHVAFSDIVAENRIIATYDFINGDTDVIDEPGRQRDHGTQVFSVLAGFDEGSLIGPAFGADFVLAKTEIVLQEIQAEEDNWVAAAEWMDSIGVDIISSSVGYIDWYDTTQLDGQTALCTRAANIAVSMGIIVVNSAGNEGNTPWRKVFPPADGDSVIAVGGVDPSGIILNLSSRGPTVDGRIKPDFCAQGSAIYAANWGGGYLPTSGTSFSAPLVAGAIALTMEAHPQWVLADILENMKSYSLRPPIFDHIGPQSVLVDETLNLRLSAGFLPDNNYGWGIPDFNAAVNLPPDWYGEEIVLEAIDIPDNSTFFDSLNGSGLFTFIPELSQIGEDTAVFTSYRGVYSDTESVRIIILEQPGSLSIVVAPHPAVDSAVFRVSPNGLGRGNVYIRDVSGALIKNIDFESSSGNFVIVNWDGRNNSGAYVASGVYILTVSLGHSTSTDKFFFVSRR